jgi:microsomal prostaglandin-E synthase 2
MTLVAKKIKKREQIQDPGLFLKEKINEWVEGLAGRPFMGGQTPNGADLAVVGIMQSVAELPAGKPLQENQEFDAWMKRLHQTFQTQKGFQYAKS